MVAHPSLARATKLSTMSNENFEYLLDIQNNVEATARETAQELMERDKRKQNVMLHFLPEMGSKGGDIHAAQQLFSAIGVKERVVDCARVGKGASRLIKITSPAVMGTLR